MFYASLLSPVFFLGVGLSCWDMACSGTRSACDLYFIAHISSSGCLLAVGLDNGKNIGAPAYLPGQAMAVLEVPQICRRATLPLVLGVLRCPFWTWNTAYNIEILLFIHTQVAADNLQTSCGDCYWREIIRTPDNCCWVEGTVVLRTRLWSCREFLWIVFLVMKQSSKQAGLRSCAEDRHCCR